MGSTVRRTRDHRILMRNTIGYARDVTLRNVDWEAIRRNHRRSIAARYPDFSDIEIEHTWGGVMGNTMNNGQFFGKLEERVYASVAYNGVGVAMGTASGGALADLAVGNATETIEEFRKLRAPAWLAPNPFLAIGVWTSLAWLQWRAGSER